MLVEITRDTWASGEALKASASPVALSDGDAVALIRSGKAKPYVEPVAEVEHDPSPEPQPAPKPKRKRAKRNVDSE